MIKDQKQQGTSKRGLLIAVFAMGVMLILPMKDSLLWAQENVQPPVTTADTTAASAPAITPAELQRIQMTNSFLHTIKAEISSNEDVLHSVTKQISETEGKITDTQGKMNTLKDQIDNLNTQIKSSEQIIQNVATQIDKKQSEIETLQYQIEQKKVEISNQKQMMAEYLKVMYHDQSDLNSFDGDESYLNTLKLLMSDDSTSDKLRSIKYSEVLEEQGRDIFERLGKLIEEQETGHKILEVKKHTLTILYENLADQKQDLEVKKQAKQNLLEETKGQEEIYQELLAQTKANQEEVLSEIDTLRKNLSFVQKRMKDLGSKFDPDDYANLLNVQKSSKLLDYLTSIGKGEFLPVWPVNPDRGISAFFHEASYYSFFHMQHQAVDIRAYQGTPLKAAADGVVYRAKDNGYGYSYIMLAHAGGYMTLYGHVSEIMVTEGQEIGAGDIIGLSGATPGTKGAGLYTTGPHLHFEVMKSGKYVDPLSFLNLAYLRLDTLPEKYLAKALGDRTKIRRMPLKVRNKENLNNEALAQNITEPMEQGD